MLLEISSIFEDVKNVLFRKIGYRNKVISHVVLGLLGFKDNYFFIYDECIFLQYFLILYYLNVLSWNFE